MNEKKYYWIKLKDNFFGRDEIDFLLSQKNGCEYIVLYQMLCLNTCNNDGRLESKIGEAIIPYNPEKISRDTKFFDVDTVIVALELYKKLGLIYEGDDKVLKISQFDNLVGSETKYAEKMRKYREKLGNKPKEIGYNVTDNVTYNVRQDKEIDKEIDKDIILTNNTIYDFLENNFGRTISPIEYEKINCWIQEFNEEFVKHAIQTAVFSNVKTFKYVEGILKNWKANGFKTIQDIKEREAVISKPVELEEEYDWLNED